MHSKILAGCLFDICGVCIVSQQYVFVNSVPRFYAAFKVVNYLLPDPTECIIPQQRKKKKPHKTIPFFYDAPAVQTHVQRLKKPKALAPRPPHISK
jgi:hypothetical protein